MTRRVAALTSLVMTMGLLACGGNTPASPGSACEPVVGPTTRTLRSGDIFRFRFSVSSANEANVLYAFMGEGASGLSQAAMNVRLYDGLTLLGAVEDYQDTVVLWKSAGSAVPLTSLVIDFRTILNGTIDGRVEFLVTRGSLTVQRLDLADVLLERFPDVQSVGAPAISGRELCR